MIAGSGQGGDFYSDEYYKDWPFHTSEHEIQVGHYLESMTPQQELAVFLSIRGAVLRSAGRFAEARLAFERAHEIMPESPEYSYYLATVPDENSTHPLSSVALGGRPQSSISPLDTDAQINQPKAIHVLNGEQMAISITKK